MPFLTPGVAFVAPAQFDKRGANRCSGGGQLRGPRLKPPRPRNSCAPCARGDSPGSGGHRGRRSGRGETAASIDAAAFLSAGCLGDRGGASCLSLSSDGRVPIDRHSHQGGGDEPAVVGAAYGVMVAVFHGVRWVGDRHRPHRADRPMDPAHHVHHLFGLSMDYEGSFANQRRVAAHRRQLHGRGRRRGPHRRIITAAAAIMFCVSALRSSTTRCTS